MLSRERGAHGAEGRLWERLDDRCCLPFIVIRALQVDRNRHQEAADLRFLGLQKKGSPTCGLRISSVFVALYNVYMTPAIYETKAATKEPSR